MNIVDIAAEVGKIYVLLFAAMVLVVIVIALIDLLRGLIDGKLEPTALIVDFAADINEDMPTFCCPKCDNSIGFADIKDVAKRQKWFTFYQNGREIRLFCAHCEGTVTVCNGEVTQYEGPEKSAILDGN